VIPRLERGECLNAGVVLYCRTRGYLEARTRLDRERLRVLAPQAPQDAIEAHLSTLEWIAEGNPAGGAVAALAQSERFHWLVAPSSTVVPALSRAHGPVGDPGETLDRLFERLVA
jgi:hypothetical protein